MQVTISWWLTCEYVLWGGLWMTPFCSLELPALMNVQPTLWNLTCAGFRNLQRQIKHSGTHSSTQDNLLGSCNEPANRFAQHLLGRRRVSRGITNLHSSLQVLGIYSCRAAEADLKGCTYWFETYNLDLADCKSGTFKSSGLEFRIAITPSGAYTVQLYTLEIYNCRTTEFKS